MTENYPDISPDKARVAGEVPPTAEEVPLWDLNSETRASEDETRYAREVPVVAGEVPKINDCVTSVDVPLFSVVVSVLLSFVGSHVFPPHFLRSTLAFNRSLKLLQVIATISRIERKLMRSNEKSNRIDFVSSLPSPY